MSKVFVVTGPSGVGKGTLIDHLLVARPGLELSRSATTRSPRSGERDGREYVFIGEDEFNRRVAAGDFIEHASYIGNWYGTPKNQISDRLSRGKSVVLEIELQGARQIRAAMPEAVEIFIAPPSIDELCRRLNARDTDTADEIHARLQTAEKEIEAAKNEFVHIIVNDSLERAARELTALVDSCLQAKS